MTASYRDSKISIEKRPERPLTCYFLHPIECAQRTIYRFELQGYLHPHRWLIDKRNKRPSGQGNMERKNPTNGQKEGVWLKVFCTPVKTKPLVPCTDFRTSRWNHALHHQRAASNPSVLWAATGSQPAAIVHVLREVQRLDLLSMQIKPASLHLHLQHTRNY